MSCTFGEHDTLAHLTFPVSITAAFFLRVLSAVPERAMPRILVIEDNEVNQELVARYLELFGYEVALAGDGCTGLSLASDVGNDFAAVLLDMNLPDVDGWEVARRLKADAKTRGLPVIAVTAHAMIGDRENVLAAGCDDYVTKPIDFQLLFQKMQDLICKAELV